MTHTFPLHFQAGHLFAEIAGDRWLFDTGAPLSFGEVRELRLAGERFSLGQRYVGLDAAALSRLVGVNCTGLLGADILGCWRRFKSEPPCRLNNEPGVEANPLRVSCG